MDNIPDHIKEKIMCSNNTVDWVTEEWFRRSVASPKTGRRVSDIRVRALRSWLSETRHVVLSQLSAATDRS